MRPKLTQPIAEFMHACYSLITDPMTRDTLTQEELDILETCIDLITKKFFSPLSQSSGEMSRRQPSRGDPHGVPLPHSDGSDGK
jgi:hypothetical protein